MKNKSKEYKILLLYDILATSYGLCSASPAYTTILQLGQCCQMWLISRQVASFEHWWRAKNGGYKPP